MSQFTRLLLAAVLVFSASPAWADSFSFATGQPDGRMAAASRPESGNLIEIEAADDFITTAEQTTLTNATFFGLLPGTTAISSIEEVVVEIYRVFPLDSHNPADGKVPTRNNSPSDVAFDTRDSDQAGQLTFTTTGLGAFTAANSVLNGIHPSPNQATLGEGPVTGTQVRIDVAFTSPLRLPPGHYFVVPQVKLDGTATFFWLSAPGNNPPLFQGDLQAWIRNADLDPNWLRIGTDIVDGSAPIPTFNMAFVVTGTTEAASLRAAILPSSRSVQVGTTATAFATVINPTGAPTARNVGISLNTPIPANFSFQRTDPVTNALVGQPNEKVDLAPGQSQTFVIVLTPTDVIDPPKELSFAFSGGNAPVISGVDTLLFSASLTAVPDIVALAGTINNDGIVNIPGPNGTGVFVVATINLGSDALISATADTGTAQLPVTLSLCQTNPANSQCLNPPTPTTNPVTADISHGGTATFGIFVAGSGTVPFDPAKNRIFVRFKDANGVVHGTTSVAVRTQ